jgi:hypothetical protein
MGAGTPSRKLYDWPWFSSSMAFSSAWYSRIRLTSMDLLNLLFPSWYMDHSPKCRMKRGPSASPRLFTTS